MAGRLGAVAVLVEIAMRNLLVGRAKTLIVGGIVLVGAAVAVVGSSVIETMDAGMKGSVQGSLGGQLQVYSARSRDELALFGKPGGEMAELEPIEDVDRLKRALAGIPNVKAVVPMGIDVAMVSTGNELDAALEALRAEVRARGDGGGGASLDARYRARLAHVRRMVTLLRDEVAEGAAVLDPQYAEDRAQDQADRERAASDAFWAAFEADPLAGLEFLENRIAPQSLTNAFTMLRYVGTDLDAYQRAFDRMHLVEGTPIPAGEKGILLGKLFADDWLKLRPARLLDRVREERLRGRRIDTDPELARWLKEARGQLRDILLQLDPLQAEEATGRLARSLGAAGGDLAGLLRELFTCTDATFDEHHAIFYRDLAPLLRLHSVRVGDFITLKAPSRTGYMNTVRLKVHGLVEFRGLEKSTIAGWLNFMDIGTWRDLYGYMTPERAAEIEAIKAGVGARSVAREDAEAELFGGGASASERPGDGAPAAGPVGPPDGTTPAPGGAVALNAALVLHDPSRSAETMAQVKAALGAAGLDLKVIGWQEAAGVLGQFVSLARIVLYSAVLLIFAVALVIISNATVMATLQRVREIGTLRAIGAQKRFVVVMLILETTVVGLVFGAIGAVVGAGLVAVMRLAGGVPATNDEMFFFFAGPSLLPRLGALGPVVALAAVLVVSVLSGLYPALVATRVTPLQAMQADD